MKKPGTALAAALGLVGGLIAGSAAVFKIMGQAVSFKEKKRFKFKSYYEMTNQWLILKEEGKPLEEYFLRNGYKTLAIYGMGEMGNRLYEELSKSEKVKVKYAIDEKAVGVYSDLDVVSAEDGLDVVDVVVVTAIFDFDEIQGGLSEKLSCPIVSLEEIVYEL